MGEVILGGGVAIGAGLLAWALRLRRLHAQAVERLAEPTVKVAEEEHVDPAPALRRYMWAPPMAATVVSAGLWLLLSWPPVFCVAVGVLVLALSWLLEVNLAEGRGLRLEAQLADAIDMIVGALGAGAGAMDAMDSAANESPRPLDQELHNLVARIRYGDPPAQVYQQLSERVPLETFELYAFTLSVHEETGGSLTHTLATVGRTIRDRIELRRRVRAQATQAQASVVGILFIVYGIALVTWRTNPERMEAFVQSELGIGLLSAAMMLQAVGLAWMYRLSRIKY